MSRRSAPSAGGPTISRVRRLAGADQGRSSRFGAASSERVSEISSLPVRTTRREHRGGPGPSASSEPRHVPNRYRPRPHVSPPTVNVSLSGTRTLLARLRPERPMRLLLIEDDPSVAGSIELMLKSEDFQVETTHLGEDGVNLGRVNEYGLILLDLNLPDISGYEVLRSLRVNRIRTPVLILSGLADIQHKVKGLGFGADDYLTKPFHKDELLARIRAVLRRSGDQSENMIRCGDLVVNLDHKRVEIAGRDPSSRLHDLLP